MARYIDVDKLMESMINGLFPNEKIETPFDVLRVIEQTPTADVVEVVRCKGCKHYKPYANPVEDFDGECIVRECETDENEFCSYGTPKERGGENALRERSK